MPVHSNASWSFDGKLLAICSTQSMHTDQTVYHSQTISEKTHIIYWQKNKLQKKIGLHITKLSEMPATNSFKFVTMRDLNY